MLRTGCTICLREQNNKNGDCGLMMRKSTVNGCKANLLLGGWVQEEWPVHVAGRGGMVFGCPCQKDQLATQS